MQVLILMTSYDVRSINHNISVGAGFGDCQLLAGIVGEPAPTKIDLARPDMISVLTPNQNDS